MFFISAVMKTERPRQKGRKYTPAPLSDLSVSDLEFLDADK